VNIFEPLSLPELFLRHGWTWIMIGLCCEYISWTFGITRVLDFAHHPEF
jgi:hypothetical protein